MPTGEYIESVRKVVTDSLTTVYQNNSSGNYITDIVVCNTSGSSATIFLYILNADENAPVGALYSGLSLEANESAIMPQRIIEPNGRIRVYSGTTDVIIISADIFKYNNS